MRSGTAVGSKWPMPQRVNAAGVAAVAARDATRAGSSSARRAASISPAIRRARCARSDSSTWRSTPTLRKLLRRELLLRKLLRDSRFEFLATVSSTTRRPSGSPRNVGNASEIAISAPTVTPRSPMRRASRSTVSVRRVRPVPGARFSRESSTPAACRGGAARYRCQATNPRAIIHANCAGRRAAPMTAPATRNVESGSARTGYAGFAGIGATGPKRSRVIAAVRRPSPSACETCRATTTPARTPPLGPAEASETSTPECSMPGTPNT
ncbi:Uncharacterised protein [Mycobacteroides abscessus subsp. abscessus]|nr:Uncharacterised protein [Mycobacteroides abscessus subsp. abscessus]